MKNSHIQGVFFFFFFPCIFVVPLCVFFFFLLSTITRSYSTSRARAQRQSCTHLGRKMAEMQRHRNDQNPCSTSKFDTLTYL